MKMTTHQYCKKIRETREELGITQLEAAQILEVKERTYNGWENGRKDFRLWEFNGIKATLIQGTL